MKTAIYLERHVYAPELNTIHYIKNGERYSVSAPGVKTISSYKERLRKRKAGKFASISYTNRENPSLNREYSGRVGGYREIASFLKEAKKRHCMPGGEFSISIATF